jgi:hypothetical protein
MIINHDVLRMWKEAVMLYFIVLFQHLFGSVAMKNLNWDSPGPRFRPWDLTNRGKEF